MEPPRTTCTEHFTVFCSREHKLFVSWVMRRRPPPLKTMNMNRLLHDCRRHIEVIPHARRLAAKKASTRFERFLLMTIWTVPMETWGMHQGTAGSCAGTLRGPGDEPNEVRIRDDFAAAWQRPQLVRFFYLPRSLSTLARIDEPCQLLTRSKYLFEHVCVRLYVPWATDERGDHSVT